jgi:hypothetical protein
MKESPAAATASLQKRVAELEKLLAKQKRSRQLQQENENESKTSQIALDTLRLDEAGQR